LGDFQAGAIIPWILETRLRRLAADIPRVVARDGARIAIDILRPTEKDILHDKLLPVASD
jgi:hypothetical protein